MDRESDTVVTSAQGSKENNLSGLRVLIVVTKDWYFLSHRVPLARALEAAGAEVSIAAGDTGRKAEVESLGYSFYPIPFNRGGMRPWEELSTVRALARLLSERKPDVVHNIAIKPALYGSLCAVTKRVPTIFNTVTGLGYLFTSSDFRARLVRRVVSPLFRFIGMCSQVNFIFFNQDDQKLFCSYRFTNLDQSTVITGSGVDVERFVPSKDCAEEGVIILCARMLWDKGIGELIEAARVLKQEKVPFRLLLIGNPDTSNPKSIPSSKLKEWEREGLCEVHGFVDKIENLLKTSAIAVLPSYREGMPLFLLEAMASGLPVVTTDVPGCRELIVKGANGIMVPRGSVKELATALKLLLGEPDLRKAMGRESRKIAVREYSIQKISQAIVRFYEEKASV